MGATPLDGAMCQRHMFSTDRNGVKINDADGKSGKLYGWLLIIRCTSIDSKKSVNNKRR